MKQFLIYFFAFSVIGSMHAQLSVYKDYTRNGARIIELDYEGVAYSIIYDQLTSTNQSARLVIKNLLNNKDLELTVLPSQPVGLNVSYQGFAILEVTGAPGSLEFNESIEGVDKDDKLQISEFGDILSEVRPEWPSAIVDEGGIEAMHDWRIVGVAGGGTRSLAEHRCEHVFEETITAPGCKQTTDCHCMTGRFLCICVCGLLCE